ncbi:ATP-binding cassette sub-family G member 1-like [Euwallacea similis]|uniref:ATP-binding cassette sub-family G member 1-like n=1 Tax=Euwallacea similis TaxID=1736056 RepID=UPI00344F4B93
MMPEKPNSLPCCQSNKSLSSLKDSSDKDAIGQINNNVIIPERVKNQYIFPKRQNVDLEFENLTFSCTSWSVTKFKKETKNILHGVSGKFNSGQLSVIMGPSGAGKSTLLNILAGYITRGSAGTIKLNGITRDRRPLFPKLCAYIPQDEELRLGLTTMEAMTFAANLKLGYSVSSQYKKQQVAEILALLGLSQSHHTLTSRLSGGQRKRLAVALELLSNPPILFLDEPTTGLDSSSCTQCLYLFKRLAQEGRTIICTIHQPSALLFEMFDKLYALSEGKCIYDGLSRQLVPYLNDYNIKCPPYHNPADFLIELASGEHSVNLEALANAVKQHQHKEVIDTKGIRKKNILDLKSDIPSIVPAPVIMQFFLLYKRNMLETKRNWLYPMNRILAHVLIGLLFGYLYRGVGANANKILANYIYLYGTMLLNVYTGKMSVTLSFPLEMKILTREHFNRWYKLSPYLLSVILIEIPFQVLCTWIYIAISYYLTSQPIDYRAYHFVFYVTIGTLCAQSMGYFIGATTSTKIAVFIGPVLACCFSVFGFCLRRMDTPYFFRWLFTVSYFRAAFHGMVMSVYGFNRADLLCPEEEMYCHYEDPSKFLREMDIVNVDLVSNISLVVFIWSLMHAATYLTLWFKLNKR